MSKLPITQEEIDANRLKSQLWLFNNSICNPSIPCHVQSPKVRIAMYTLVRCFLEREIPEQSFDVQLVFQSKFPQNETAFEKTWWFSETMSTDKTLSSIQFVANKKCANFNHSSLQERLCVNYPDLFFQENNLRKIKVSFLRCVGRETDQGIAIGGHKLFKSEYDFENQHAVYVFYLESNYHRVLEVVSHELTHVKQSENDPFLFCDRRIPYNQRPQEIEAMQFERYADGLVEIIYEKILATSVYDLL